MEDFDEGLDILNEETFDGAEIGDWEVEHEKFVFELKDGTAKPPNADELPKFWEGSDGLSYLWHSGDLASNLFCDEVVDVESSIRKLVSDDNFEDPAIIDIKKKSSNIIDDIALFNLRETPAYPKITSSILDYSKDIWSINNCRNIKEETSLIVPDKKYPKHLEDQNLQEFQCAQLNNMLHYNVQKSFPLSFNPLQRQSEMGIPNSGFHSHSQMYDSFSKKNHIFPTFASNNTVFQTSSDRAINLPHNSAMLPSPNFFQCIPPPAHYTISNNGNVPIFPPPGFVRLTYPNIPCNTVRFPMFLQNKSENTNEKPSSMQTNLFGNSVYSFKQNIDPVDSVSTNVFDPNSGGWMTKSETVHVLLSQLRPLITSNPYVQDYYFAKRWMNFYNTSGNKQNGIHHPASSAITLIPIPISFTSINDPNSLHQIILKRKFIVPYSSTNLGHDRNTVENMNQLADETKSINNEPIHSNSDFCNALGRRTRSTFHSQRVVAELSLVSMLTDDVAQSNHSNPDTSSNLQNEVPSSYKNAFLARHRLILLAKIERMYSILLILDEVSISLLKVLVQNDARIRLLDYRKELTDRLACELFKYNEKPSEDLFELTNNTNLLKYTDDLFTIRKGMQLSVSILRYFPSIFTNKYLSEFMRDFVNIQKRWPITLDEAATMLYPKLRELIYEIRSINEFLNSSFPEVENTKSLEALVISKNLRSLLTCKLGLSLIFCLLDACARASNPTDPSDFIRFGAFFGYANSLIDLIEPVPTMESFPHLASILELYIKPAKHLPLSATHLSKFCKLMNNSKTDPNHTPDNESTADIGNNSVADIATNLNDLLLEKSVTHSNNINELTNDTVIMTT